MRPRKIVAPAVLICFLCEPALCYPIPPQSLRRLVLDSELVVVATVEKEMIGIARLRISDILKGPISDVLKGESGQQWVYVYSRGWVCPAPAYYPETLTVLAFLKRRGSGGGYRTCGLSYGSKLLSGDDLKTYVARVRELLAIEREPDEKTRLERTVEWLVTCTEHPATRREGLYDLQGVTSRYLIGPKGKTPRKDPEFGRYLTENQRRRLCAVLRQFRPDEDGRAQQEEERPPNGKQEPRDGEAALREVESRLQKLWSSLLGQAWRARRRTSDAGTLMSILADAERNGELARLAERFSGIDRRDKRKAEKQKALIAEFIRAYEQQHNQRTQPTGPEPGG